MENEPGSEVNQHLALRRLGRFALMTATTVVSIGAVEVVTGAVFGHPVSLPVATAAGGGANFSVFGIDYITR